MDEKIREDMALQEADWGRVVDAENVARDVLDDADNQPPVAVILAGLLLSLNDLKVSLGP